jgi:hypothetical protein
VLEEQIVLETDALVFESLGRCGDAPAGAS